MADITIGGMTPAGRSLAPTDKLEIEATGPLGLYLTGQNIIDSGNAQTDLRILAPAATVTALAAINTSSLPAGTSIQVGDTALTAVGKYILQKNNTTAIADNFNTVRSTANPSDNDLWSLTDRRTDLLRFTTTSSSISLAAKHCNARLYWTATSGDGVCILPTSANLALVDNYSTLLVNAENLTTPHGGIINIIPDTGDTLLGDQTLFSGEAALIILSQNGSTRIWRTIKISSPQLNVRSLSATAITMDNQCINSLNLCTAATATTIQVRQDSNILIGSQAVFLQYGAGQLTFANYLSGIVRNPDSAFKSRKLYSKVTVTKLTSTDYLVDGDTVI